MTLSLARRADTVTEAEPFRPRVTGLLRRHWLAVLVLGLGFLLRLLVMIAYPRGFWIQGDSQEYLGSAFSFVPGYTRPSGYSIFLSLLVPFGTTQTVLIVQHLCGLAIAGASYGFLYRRGVHRIVAAIAITPMLLEARVVILEHYLLADAFFTAVLVTAILVLLWRDRPGWRRFLLVGLLFAVAAVTRSVAMAVLVLPVIYLVIRRLGWRQLIAFAAALVLGLGTYAGAYHAAHGQWAFSGYSGRFLWARTTTFMDCSKLDLTPAEKPICPTEPIGQRPNPGYYLWTTTTSVHKYTTDAGDKIHEGLAIKAITHQPGDYLALVARGTWALMLPGIPNGSIVCDYYSNIFPTGAPTDCPIKLAPPNLYTRHFVGDSTSLGGSPLRTLLNGYGRVALLPASVSAVAFLFTLVVAFVRTRRRSSLRDRLDPLLLTTIAFGMILLSVAAAAPDTRYETPSMPFAMLGAALALGRFVRPDRPDPTDPPPTVDAVDADPVAA